MTTPVGISSNGTSLCLMLEASTTWPLIPGITASEVNAIQVTMQILNMISLIVSLWVVVTYLLFKREFPKSMPLFFGISAFLLHAFLFTGSVAGPVLLCRAEILCIIQGVGVQYFGAVTMYWFLAIAISLYFMLVRQSEWGRFRLITHCLVWGVPVIQTVIPIIFKKYESRFFWCWISQDDGGVWEFTLLYGQMALVCIGAAILWLIVVIRMCHARRKMNRFERHVPKIPPSMIRHIIGVVLLGAVFIVMLAHRIFNLYHPIYNFAFLLIHTATLSGVGMIVFISFGTSKDNFVRWREALCPKPTGSSDRYEPLSSN